MNKFIAIVVVAMVGVGCASSQPAIYPCAEPLPKKEIISEDVKVFVSKGTSWFWNESTQAWEWMTSEENKGRASRAWATTKQVASEAYDKAVKAYHEHSDAK